jgi:acyl carrier protein
MGEQTVQVLKRILINDLFVDVSEAAIGPDDGLQTTLGLDSISFVELRVKCEEIFGIIIEDQEFSPENFRTLNLLARFVEGKQTSRGKANVA